MPPPTIGLERAGEGVPVITSESLVGSPLTGGDNAEMILHRLHETLPQSRILIVIREQRAMLRSLYQLLVNWGSPHSIDVLINNTLPGNAPRFRPEFLCFDRMIKAYQASFGEKNVLVLPMEFFQQRAEIFLESVNNFCGVDMGRFPISADTSKRENSTRSLASLEYKRLYNRFVAKTIFNPNGFHRPHKVQGAANVNLVLPSRLAQWQETRFSNTVKLLLGDYYAQSNDRTQLLTGIDLKALGYQVSP